MFETLLIKAIRRVLIHFRNLVSECPLTYQSELIDENIQRRGRRDCFEFAHCHSFIQSINPITQPSG